MWYTSSCGKIEIEMTKAQAASCSHQGPCDADVAMLRQNPKIKRQLVMIDAQVLIDELKGYGAWEEHELQNHSTNLDRILWIAACDINEEYGR